MIILVANNKIDVSILDVANSNDRCMRLVPHGSDFHVGDEYWLSMCCDAGS
jgi:hypothetical protein